MRIIDRGRSSCPVDTEAQLIDPFWPERQPILNSAVLIPRQVKSRESRRKGAQGANRGHGLSVLYRKANQLAAAREPPFR